ncbi:MAG: inositol monophosphatase [Thermoleophilia bacterium]|jgi:myo-inositol-1(or 4)-monophosphatase|nr:inositol monophosphatase [Thermoleophilia bacterium]
MNADVDTRELSRALFAAEQAVDLAAAEMVRSRSHVKALIDKGDYGFATVVDVAIERIVRAQLSKEMPEVPILGEEEGGVEVASEAVWVLDPIDGTANYADGSPLCAISLAFVRAGQPAVGIVAAPLLGERFVAIAGAGAFRNGAPIQVAPSEVGDSLVALSDFAFGHKHRRTNRLRFAVIEELVNRSMRLRIHGSVALDMAWLAAGRMSATIALSNRPWDVSAGVLLVREAGGMVFDEAGKPHEPSSSSTLASTPTLRETLISVVAAARDRVED